MDFLAPTMKILVLKVVNLHRDKLPRKTVHKDLGQMEALVVRLNWLKHRKQSADRPSQKLR